MLVVLVAAIVTGSLAIVLAGFLVLLLLFYPVFLYLWDRIYGVEDIADQVFRAPTDDGWQLALHFHRPTYPRPGAYPVIISHGIANNKFGVDLDRNHSLAYYLKQNGYPVFVVSLRGCGKSRFSARSGFHDFTFDDIVEYDVPAVIRKVRELTGSPRVNWVGHSMGGMIAYGYLGRKLPGYEDIATMTALGSPARLDTAMASLMGGITNNAWINKIVDIRFGAQILSPFTGRFPSPIEDILYRREAVSRTTFRKLMKNGVENIANGLANQFIEWLKTGREHTRDGSFNYREGFKNIKIPLLVVSGSKDMVAIAESVRYGYEQAGSKKKKYFNAGKEDGASVDYCHTGLVLGEKASQDIFPMVLSWLDEHGCERRFRFPFQKIIQRFRRKRKWKTRKRGATLRGPLGDVISS